MKTIAVTRKIDDLTTDLYAFWFNESTMSVVLSVYKREQIKSKRHKNAEVVQGWSRLKHDARDWQKQVIPSRLVPWDASIAEEALKAFTSQLSVKSPVDSLE